MVGRDTLERSEWFLFSAPFRFKLSKRVLVHCKPGIIHLWCPPSHSIPWSGYRSFLLQTQKLSIGSSALHPASGIQYIRRLDTLVVTLFDGSFHVVHNISNDPSMTPGNPEVPVTSERLSMVVRSTFVQSEQHAEFSDVNRITGLMSYDGSATLFWIQE